MIKNKKILIVGAGGFIGGHLTKKLLENKNSIKTSVNENEAQFLILANKFNEAVEVILELSEKVEKLEKKIYQKRKY